MKKRTKKEKWLGFLIALLLVVVIAVSAYFTIELVKNSGDTVISLDGTTALAGDTIKIPFSIDNNHGLWGGQVIINYDAKALEFVSCTNENLFDKCDTNDNGGSLCLVINQIELEDIEDDGLIATLNFRIKDLADGKYDISFDPETNFCDSEGELKEISFESATVTVK